MSRVRLVIDAEIVDEEALRKYATERYAACWGPAEQPSGSLAYLTLEALVLSNENPSPNEYGLDLIEYSAELLD